MSSDEFVILYRDPDAHGNYSTGSYATGPFPSEASADEAWASLRSKGISAKKVQFRPWRDVSDRYELNVTP